MGYPHLCSISERGWWGEGDLVTFPELADTLEAISQNGTDAFYTDSRIAQSDTVNASGGIMNLEDLRTYTVKLEEPLMTQYNRKFNGPTVCDSFSRFRSGMAILCSDNNHTHFCSFKYVVRQWPYLPYRLLRACSGKTDKTSD